MNTDNSLKLENQLCFPLYACSKEVIRKYTPFLDEMGITYTQYLVLMVLWEKKRASVKSLGTSLYLDSGTLTPLLKKMEAQGLVTRTRDAGDERSVIVSLTERGAAMRDRAEPIPAMVGQCVNLDPEEARTLYRLLYKVLGNLPEGEKPD